LTVIDLSKKMMEENGMLAGGSAGENGNSSRIFKESGLFCRKQNLNLNVVF
tara:strand:- start:353 stop:505 length:153 start_codon:yes stop_codon:yes gene_type:complete